MDNNFLGKVFLDKSIFRQLPSIPYQYNKRQKVFQKDKIKLFHYSPLSNNLQSPPLLVVFATVNRPEILDLFPKTSFIRGLLEGGTDVYLLDWGYPDKKDCQLGLNDYVNYLHDCVSFIKTYQKSAQQKINLLGICQGGLLSLLYVACYQDIQNLILISTPIDFHTKENVITKLLANLNLDDLLTLSPNISGMALTQFFISLRPFELVGKKYLKFFDHLNDTAQTKKFLRVEKWLYDAPDQPGKAFSELVKDFYQQNKLIKNNFRVNNQPILLKNIHLPILNVMARFDEIIPMSASSVLKKYIGSSDYTEQIFASGHIGIYVSDKVGKTLPKAIVSWLEQRENTA